MNMYETLKTLKMLRKQISEASLLPCKSKANAVKNQETLLSVEPLGKC